MVGGALQMYPWHCHCHWWWNIYDLKLKGGQSKQGCARRITSLYVKHLYDTLDGHNRHSKISSVSLAKAQQQNRLF